jgi:hypothetical protein
MFEYYRWNVFRNISPELLRKWSADPPNNFVRLRVSEVRAWLSAIAILEVADKYSIKI